MVEKEASPLRTAHIKKKSEAGWSVCATTLHIHLKYASIELFPSEFEIKKHLVIFDFNFKKIISQIV